MGPRLQNNKKKIVWAVLSLLMLGLIFISFQTLNHRLSNSVQCETGWLFENFRCESLDYEGIDPIYPIMGITFGVLFLLGSGVVLVVMFVIKLLQKVLKKTKE